FARIGTLRTAFLTWRKPRKLCCKKARDLGERVSMLQLSGAFLPSLDCAVHGNGVSKKLTPASKVPVRGKSVAAQPGLPADSGYTGRRWIRRACHAVLL